MVKLFVGNIASGVTDDELKSYFAEYGSVTECDVLGSYGFVHMATDDEAEEAIKNMDKFSIKGQALNVEKSKSGGGGGRRGGGGGGGRNDRRSGNGYGGGGFMDNSSEAKAARRAGCCKLHIASLADGMNSKDLRRLFERYGYVAECDVVEDRKIGFVHIEAEAADAAILGLNGLEIRGVPMKVQMSKNQNNDLGSMGGGFGGGMRSSLGGRGSMGRGRGFDSYMGSGFGARSRYGYGDDYGGYDDLGGSELSLPPPAKGRMELLELLDRRRRLEALDSYEKRLIACPDPFNLPPPPPEYLRLLRERAMVKARLPPAPSTGSLAASRATQAQSAVGSSSASLQRALIARRAAAVAANAREKLRSSGASLDAYGEGDVGGADDYMYGSAGLGLDY